MRIFLVNKFLYPKGGDAICTLASGDLLRKRGHEVVCWGMKHPSSPQYPNDDLFVDNLDLSDTRGMGKQLAVVGKLLYSVEAKKKIEILIEKVGKPDIVHLHNFAHQISPSILDVLKKHNIPVVMTMHDYKLVCAAYTFLSHGKPCEKCAGGKYYHCFLEGCVKDSKTKSLLNTAEMYLHHKLLHIYDSIHTFISPSRFLKDKVAEMGFKGTVVRIPNFVHMDEFTPCYTSTERSICYVGRLSKEKGVVTLIEAVKGLDVTLKIIGDGPLRASLEQGARSREPLPTPNSQLPTNVKFLGYMTGDALKEEIRKSMFMVIPSEWYENNPRSVIEAFALGKPVVGARIGGIPELVRDGETGWTYEPFSASDLREKIVRLMMDPASIKRMGENARKMVEVELNPEVHYRKLMKVYEYAKIHDTALLDGLS